MGKSLNDIEVGDRVVSMGAKKFDSVFECTGVSKDGEHVVCALFASGQFWPMAPGQAACTTIEVLA